jgi:hypothetical protein
MTNKRNNIVLKGQSNLARGSAPGINTSKKVVCAMTFFKRQLLFRTKVRYSCFPQNNESKFRPKEVFRIDNIFSADGFCYVSLTLGDAQG